MNDRVAFPLLVFSLPFIAVGMVPQGLNIMMAGPVAGRISSPLGILSFLHVLSKNNILIKDGRALEALTTIDTVIFDKTGTLTLNKPHVEKVYSFGELTENQVLAYAAVAEQRQSHPIALAILEEVSKRQLILPDVENVQCEIGLGIKAFIDGKTVFVGSMRFVEKEGILLSNELKEVQRRSHEKGHSLVVVVIGSHLSAIELSPTIRPGAFELVEILKKNYDVYIVSGDHEEPTKNMAKLLGIDNYFAEVLPEGKANVIKKLRKQGKSTCFIGDGINDAIALKAANVSISLADASSIAVNTASIILQKDDLKGLSFLFNLTKEFKRNAFTNNSVLLTTCAAGVYGSIFLGWGLFAGFIVIASSLSLGVLNSSIPLIKDHKKLIKKDDGD